jgi:hypothetical protein
MEQANESFLKRTGIKDWGDERTPPTPYTKCDISEFWTEFMSYGIRDIEYRQITTDNGDFKYSNVHILKYNDRAFMIQVNRHNVDGKYIDIPDCYRLGCIHEYNSVILNNRSGDCRNTCRKCGYSYVYNCGD